MTALFVTATGTDIGKTFVARGLIHALRQQGRTVAALKPVVSGFDPAMAAASDPGLLLAALGQAVTPAAIERIAPWRFAAPLSPDLAARAEGRTLDVAALIEFCRAEIATGADALVIEGVGGIMVPLDERTTVLDWMAALGLPLVLVTGSYLGTISHTLTALDVLARRSLAVAAVVVSETEGSAVPLDDTVATIARFAPSSPVIALPRLPARELDHPAFSQILRAAS
jgi:dethiobiotin synthetase